MTPTLAARTRLAAPCLVSAPAAAEGLLHLAAAVDSLCMLTYNVYWENFLRVHASAIMPEIIPTYTGVAINVKSSSGVTNVMIRKSGKRMMFLEWWLDLD